MAVEIVTINDRNKGAVCVRCGGGLRFGEKVVSKNSKVRKHYRIAWWKSMFLS